MTRKEFLTEFLGALGAVDILWAQSLDNYISGRIIYEFDDPEEVQDFCWHRSDKNMPDDSVCQLAMLLNKNQLLDIDKITVSRDSLHSLYSQEFNVSLSQDQFNKILVALEEIEVPMVDDGKETDIFFIHE